MKVRNHVVTLCVVLAGLCALANANTTDTLTLLAPAQADAVLARISKRLGAVRSFEAAFMQDHHLAMYLDVLKASGRCFFAAPDRFRWETITPYHSILVFNRDRVAKFEDRGGAMKYVESGAYDIIRGLMSQMTGWMRGDFKADKDAFGLSVGEESQAYVLQLTPRAKEMRQYIERIEVHVAKNTLQIARIMIREPEQDYIEIGFSAVRENTALDEKIFDTKDPLILPAPRHEQK